MQLASDLVTENFDKNKTILFYTPEAGVSPHLAAQCVIARTLKELGYKVIFARCTACFNRCPVMDMHRLPYVLSDQQRSSVCSSCLSNSHAMLNSYGLDSIEIREHLAPEVFEHISQIINTIPEDVESFHYDGFAFGKACVLDFVLATKISKLKHLRQESRQIWNSYIVASLISYYAVQSICKAHNVGTIVHFNDYSMLLGARFASQKLSIPCKFVTLAGHKGIDRRRYVIFNNAARPVFRKQVDDWPKWSNLSIEESQIKEVAEDLIVHFAGGLAQVFSPAKSQQPEEIFKNLRLTKDKKLLVAYTSSQDEFFACRSNMQIFGSYQEISQPFKQVGDSLHIEWIKAVIEYVEASSDLQLVVRIHPREGATGRLPIASDHLTMLRENFSKDYQNTRIVWPEDQTSSYDLAELADLVLTSYSSMGLELARLACPVLACYKGFTVVDHPFIRWEATPEKFFKTLQELLSQPSSLELVRQAFRFYHCYLLASSIDLSDVILDANNDGLPEFKLSKQSETIEQIVINSKELPQINFEKLKQLQNVAHSDREILSLKKQLRRIVNLLMTGNDCSDDYALTYLQASNNQRFELSQGIELQANTHATQRYFISDGKHCNFIHGEKLISRYSIMAARLAQISAQTVIRTTTP